MTQKISSYRHDAKDGVTVKKAVSAPKAVSPRLDPQSGPAFFGTARRDDSDSKAPRRKIDAQEFWRRLDP